MIVVFSKSVLFYLKTTKNSSVIAKRIKTSKTTAKIMNTVIE